MNESRGRCTPTFVTPGMSREVMVLAHFAAEWRREAEALPRWRSRRRRRLLAAADLIEHTIREARR